MNHLVTITKDNDNRELCVGFDDGKVGVYIWTNDHLSPYVYMTMDRLHEWTPTFGPKAMKEAIEVFHSLKFLLSQDGLTYITKLRDLSSRLHDYLQLFQFDKTKKDRNDAIVLAVRELNALYNDGYSQTKKKDEEK
ncbi:MAG: hypothetical protein PHQ75_09155 [Thermoguttaceae bacterium]|nr:hypothetical protein [Thermoguttaceae bacterium]